MSGDCRLQSILEDGEPNEEDWASNLFFFFFFGWAMIYAADRPKSGWAK